MGADASCRCTVATASRTVPTRAANAAAGLADTWRTDDETELHTSDNREGGV